MFLEKISLLLENSVGSSVSLPASAIEVEVPIKFLHHESAEGLCIDSRTIPAFTLKILSSNVLSLKEFKLLRNIAKIAENQTIYHVVFVTNQNKNSFLKRSLRNHERMHANTMLRSIQWHVVADSIMWSYMPKIWDHLMTNILSYDVYSSRLKNYGYEPSCAAWIAITELFAISASILHAPRKKRQKLAQLELAQCSAELLELCQFIEYHWGSVESLLGWFDSLSQLCSHRSTSTTSGSTS